LIRFRWSLLSTWVQTFWLVTCCLILLLKSPTLDKRWRGVPRRIRDDVTGNHHLTSRFCRVVLGLTTISKMVLKPPPWSIGAPAIRFPLSSHPPFLFMLQMSSLVWWGVLKVSHQIRDDLTMCLYVGAILTSQAGFVGLC